MTSFDRLRVFIGRISPKLFGKNLSAVLGLPLLMDISVFRIPFFSSIFDSFGFEEAIPSGKNPFFLNLQIKKCEIYLA
jgi:hypothetical protein